MRLNKYWKINSISHDIEVVQSAVWWILQITKLVYCGAELVCAVACLVSGAEVAQDYP